MIGDGIGQRGFCGTNRTTPCDGRWGIGRGGPAGDRPTDVEAYKRHNDGTNLGFVDGHVKYSPTPGGYMDQARCLRMFGPPNTP